MQKPPNNIQTAITDQDRGNRDSAATLARKCLEYLEWACPYSTTFSNSVPPRARKEVEEEFKREFELWANTWIAPTLRRIIAKSK